MIIKQESIKQRRETCRTRNHLGYCNVSDEDCQKCKAYDYDPGNLIVGHTWEEIQKKQGRQRNLDTSQ